MIEVPGFRSEQFSFEGSEKTVYRAGSGPAVIVMHEIPGISPQVHRFATWVVEAGFSVYMPWMFGVPMKRVSRPYSSEQIFKACIGHEFNVLAMHESSPIVNWLRALARKAFGEQGGRGVGAVGMCITGNFALSMMLDPILMAPVLAEPSLPLPLGLKRVSALHASKAEIDGAHRNIAKGAKILGLRFIGDPFCTSARFKALKREFGEAFEAIELDPKCANPFGNKPAHSVLTLELIDKDGEPTKQAAERVIEFFKEQLK
jgi:dienelactone hydrolase